MIIKLAPLLVDPCDELVYLSNIVKITHLSLNCE